MVQGKYFRLVFMDSNNTFAAANTVLTASEISGPIPSPGISVTFLV